MSITQEQITAALKKLGPVSPGELADHLQVEQPALRYHLNKMLDAGATTGRRIALPDQKFDAPTAPPWRPAQVEAQQEEGTPGEEARSAAPGTTPAHHRALHPRGRRGEAPGDRQRPRAAHLQRRADGGPSRCSCCSTTRSDMNAPATAAALAEPTLRLLAIASLVAPGMDGRAAARAALGAAAAEDRRMIWTKHSKRYRPCKACGKMPWGCTCRRTR